MLSNLTIRSKLILLVSIPLVIALYFGLSTAVTTYHTKNEMSQLTTLVTLSSKMSALVHESQKERGMTAGYIGSKGAKFAKELPEQQALFNQKRQALTAELNTIDLSLYKPDYVKLVEKSLGHLAKIDEIRTQIKNLDLSLGKALGHYTTLNKLMIANIEYLTHISHNAEISENIFAFTNFLQSKERAGIERAVLTNTFANNTFATGFYEKFIGLVTAQKTYINIFISNTNADNLSFYSQAMSDPAIAEVQVMRDTAIQKASTGGFDVDAGVWFKTITKKIEKLKSIENYLTQHLLQETSLIAKTATKQFWLTLGLLLLALIVVIILATLIVRNIHHAINNLKNTMQQVEETGNFALKVSVDGKDEFAEISARFNTFTQRLKLIIDESNNVLAKVANGDFSVRVTGEAQGDLQELKNGVNHSAQSVEFTMHALGEVMTAISNGNFSVRMDEKIPDEFRRTVDLAMQSMETAVHEIGSVITKISHGEFDGRITAELKGDMDQLKTNVNQSVQQLESGMTEIIDSIVTQSNGDLTTQVNGHYEGELNRLKTAFNEGGIKLNEVINGVMQSASMVSQASQEVASGSIDLNQRTQSQAASLEETAAAMEELTSTIKHNTDNARTADQLSMNARSQAQQGQAVMSESIEAINEISDSSSKIEAIIGLIDSIAFQTNLLALNAAVEAARAGEHGRGFAVVAAEVRNLAGKSADAAKDIKSLIERSANSIQNGSEKIEHTSNSLREINESILQVSSIVSEISAASQEQQIGVEQVNQAITQIDQTTQQNAALVEETTAAAESMNHESEELKSAVSGFKTSGNLLPR